MAQRERAYSAKNKKTHRFRRKVLVQPVHDW